MIPVTLTVWDRCTPLAITNFLIDTTFICEMFGTGGFWPLRSIRNPVSIQKLHPGPGAVGLMQLLPETAKDFAVTQTENPSENIKAETKYIPWLENFWHHIPDEEQRIILCWVPNNAGQ